MTPKEPDPNDIMREHGPDYLREYVAKNGHRFNGAKGSGISNGSAATGASQLSATDDDETIAHLAKLNPVDYDRQREAAAQRLGCRASTLDAAVKAARATPSNSGGQGQPLALPEPAPWHDPVDGPGLLDGLAKAIKRHVVLPEHEANAIALWVAHAYVFEAFTVTPRLGVTSAEKRCGKTTLLDVLVCLVPRSLLASNISAAATYRTIELARPTLLVDEADTFLSDSEDLRGVLNSGHRKGGSVVRLVGDKHEPRRFATYAPVAIAMIGALPGTLADRSIPIRLERRRANETVTPFRGDRTEDLVQLARKAARWAADNRKHLADADPDTNGLFNRDADNWRPLLAIADAVGGDWPARARHAAQLLTAASATDQETIGTMVLADICALFESREVDRVTSKDIVEHLLKLEERPWQEFGHSNRPITPHALARLLKRFRVAPTNLRANGGGPQKGYFRKALQDAFDRYLAPVAVSTATPKQGPDDQGVTENFKPLHRGTL